MAAQSRDHRRGKKLKSSLNRSKGKEGRLSWKPVPLPLEAVSSGGQSDADFFQGLDFEDDDYMGIKEVEGVEVVKKEDGSIALVPKDDVSAEPKKYSLVGSMEPDVEGHYSEEECVLTVEERDAEVSGEASEDVQLSDIEFPEEDDIDTDLPDDNLGKTVHTPRPSNGEEHQVDFRILMPQEEDKQTEGTWSRKAYNKKLPGWAKVNVNLHANLKNALHKLSFTKPTSIQGLSLPPAMGVEKRDIVGIAQTGSGKTLAYGLPILNWICETSSFEDRQIKLLEGIDDVEQETRLAALILAPTRELALQVSDHLEKVIVASSADEKSRWASIATLTGGISEEKQRRLLNRYKGRGADIIVATPGRLWDMCKGDDSLTKRIKLTRFLVVDEADRMIETGHFAEMENILALVKRGGESTGSKHFQSTASIAGGATDLQTFIFSATLSKDLQKNLKRSNGKKRVKGASTLDDLIGMIDFRDEDPAVIDLSTKTRLATRLLETRVECLSSDKDLYLYYFLLRYPGRTLIFVNSIDGIRRLQPLLENLKFSVQPLHSQLQQRQRLKNLDKFRSSRLPSIQGSSILLATDVAARGLDIPAVDHVVHFQLPRSADTYVHRSGRTARAGQSGISFSLIEPAEKRLWRDLNKTLNRSDEVAPLPIEYSFLPELKERVTLARELDKLTHTERKAAHDDAWIRNLASEADMDISDDEIDIDAGKNTRVNKKVQSAKMKLEQCLQKPLSARGVSFKYITSGSRDFVQSLLNDQQHGQMIGVQKSRVESDLQKGDTSARPTKSAKRKRT